MRRSILLLLALLPVLILCSCELVYDAPPVGKVNILVYGNDYGGTESQLNKTINDAIEVGNALISLSDKSNMDYDITYLVGPTTAYNDSALQPSEVVNDVSRTALVDALTELGSADPRDLTIIFFSGHGFSEYGLNHKVEYGFDTSKTSYLAVNQTSAYGSAYELLQVGEILGLIDSIPGTKVVICDFCYSGGFVQSDYVTVTAGEFSGVSDSDLFGMGDRISESSSLFCMTAARYNQKSYENKPGHGNFTYALLQALGWDSGTHALTTGRAEKNGMISLFNVFKYCAENDDKVEQTPMMSGGSNDVILFSFR